MTRGARLPAVRHGTLLTYCLYIVHDQGQRVLFHVRKGAALASKAPQIVRNDRQHLKGQGVIYSK